MPTYLADLRADIEAALERVLAASGAPPAVADAIRYSLVAPGKRLRPILTLAAAETVGGSLGLSAAHARALAMPAACAVEMVHSYSLVHDDLPAMDNDAWRRGRATTHVVYGDGLAILAGDGLLTDAFEVLAIDASPATPAGGSTASADRRLRAIQILAGAAGSRGMVGGQAIDLAAVGGGPSFDSSSLEDMHLRKTGALIRAAASMGPSSRAVMTARSTPWTATRASSASPSRSSTTSSTWKGQTLRSARPPARMPRRESRRSRPCTAWLGRRNSRPPALPAPMPHSRNTACTARWMKLRTGAWPGARDLRSSNSQFVLRPPPSHA